MLCAVVTELGGARDARAEILRHYLIVPGLDPTTASGMALTTEYPLTLVT